MTSAQLYLPTILPQWGIFAGVVLIIIGYVEKKDLWTRLGWIVLIATSLTALYFNLFGEFTTLAEKNEPGSVVSMLTSTAWQAVAGGVLAIVSLIMFQYKKKRYALLSILTLLYFVLIFFQYYQVSRISGKDIQITPPTEQKQ